MRHTELGLIALTLPGTPTAALKVELLAHAGMVLGALAKTAAHGHCGLTTESITFTPADRSLGIEIIVSSDMDGLQPAITAAIEAGGLEIYAPALTDDTVKK